MYPQRNRYEPGQEAGLSDGVGRELTSLPVRESRSLVQPTDSHQTVYILLSVLHTLSVLLPCIS